MSRVTFFAFCKTNIPPRLSHYHRFIVVEYAVLKAGIKASRCELSLFGIYLLNKFNYFFLTWVKLS